MSHVDEDNYVIVQFDVILIEYLKSWRSSEVFVWLISPYFLNYRLPNTWPSFTSNLFNVSDIETLEDLIRLVRKNEVPVQILTHSSEQLEKQGLSKWYIQNAEDFMMKLVEIGCSVFYSSTNHGKLTATSQGVLFGSANITQKGIDPVRQDNIGHYFSKSTRKLEYLEKVEWALRKFSESERMSIGKDQGAI